MSFDYKQVVQRLVDPGRGPIAVLERHWTRLESGWQSIIIALGFIAAVLLGVDVPW